MNNSFRARLRAGDKLIGTMVTLSSPAVAEILVDVGFDWLFVDSEHGVMEPGDIQSILQAVGGRAACVVRVPSAEEAPIKKVLDLGATGVIAPQVNTPEHARRVVQYSRYAPQGSRGVGLGRAHGYGLRFQEYVEAANEQVAVIVQAEHAQAVEHIEETVQIEGIDAILIGPYDLAASLGRMSQVDHPAVVEAIDHVTKTCRSAGMPLGIFGVTAESLRPYVEQGYSLIIGGTDAVMLGGAASRMYSSLEMKEE